MSKSKQTKKEASQAAANMSTEKKQEEQKRYVNQNQRDLHFFKSMITEKIIRKTYDEIQSEAVSKLIGLCAHFAYWSVFGNFNKMPLDDYHMK